MFAFETVASKSSKIVPSPQSDQESSITEDSLSFEEFISAFGEDSLLEIDKEVQKGEDSQKTVLLDLLKSSDKVEEFELNPELTQKTSIDELKYLLYKAKNYLKTKILQKDPHLTKEQLPKSLKGLLQLADKLKIDIKKISFETISTQVDGSKKTLQKRSAFKVEENIEISDLETQKAKTIETKIQQIKETPLFVTKKRSIDGYNTITTDQLIQSKIKKEQTKKSKTSTPLDTLLKNQPQKELKQTKGPLFTLLQTKSTQQTKDIKIEESKEQKSLKNGLEELLKGDITSNEKGINPTTHKGSDTLDVKIHEAKQMMRYLSSDIKKAIDEYKPPFSRIKVKLNPQRLGEMDLTVIHRGNNVHINLSSNNAALNILTNNLHDLKTQLSQNGIENATFNFNSGAQNQQQQKNKEQNQQNGYDYFINEEQSEEKDHSLEIIIPRYI
ncbi:Flagellar hook-length control protein FliK [hydrothermal vent metagenome]|uniref:Flagellar hook-length control protein FliK n=1 Tax=hydrothermal vent metagenome TaxID=652676 RepID=A0A1W1BW46_9ZZZZ